MNKNQFLISKNKSPRQILKTGGSTWGACVPAEPWVPFTFSRHHMLIYNLCYMYYLVQL